jgi:predicted DNA-binding transcriptional regulator YafY
MPRSGGPKKLTREELRILVKQHLERAGSTGLTREDLVAAIGPANTSLATVQRVLNDLRGETYEAPIVYSARDRRWRLEVPLPMPLEAPEQDDVLTAILAQTMLEPIIDAQLHSHFDKIVEDLDARMRSRVSPKGLPPRKAVTASISLSTRMKPGVLPRIHAACRRKVVRILYESPWQDGPDRAAWHEVEPWALRVHEGALYMRAWAREQQEARTFRLAQIDAVEELEEQPPAASRQAPPIDLWGDEESGFGIDSDRPGVAVIRFHGAVARWLASVKWHPDETNVWIEPDEVLERTVAYRSCRELARRLASLLDGIASIEPAELREEVQGLVARAQML